MGAGASQHLSSLCQAQRPAGVLLCPYLRCKFWEAGQFGGGEGLQVGWKGSRMSQAV